MRGTQLVNEFSRFFASISRDSQVSSIVITIALMLFSGFALSRVTKIFRLPNVTGYILAGILIGPFCLDLVPQNVSFGMGFLADLALAFIAFSAGGFFRFSSLKKNGKSVIIITIFESIFASLAVFLASFFLLKTDLAFSIVLSALAAATAPASTMMTIRQTGAKGDFVDTLLQVVAFDDAVGLFAYSVAISIASAMAQGGVATFDAEKIVAPLFLNIAVFILGGFFGFVLKFLLAKHSADNRLIVTLAVLFSFCGICTLLDASPLLGCMSMGAVFANFSCDEKLFKQINYFSPPFLLLFFVRSGSSFQLDMLSEAGAIGVVPLFWAGVAYFFARIFGKYAGSFLGAMISKKSSEIRNFLGLALIPQAGIALGLSELGARILGGDAGEALRTIIVASSVLYEMIGPGVAKLSLYLSKSYSTNLEDLTRDAKINENGKPLSEAEILIERIKSIQKNLPAHKYATSEEEEAFLEAAEAEEKAFFARPRIFGRRHDDPRFL